MYAFSQTRGFKLKYSLADIEVELTAEVRQIEAPGYSSGSAQIAIVRTPDLLVAEIQVNDFGPEKTEVRLTNFLSSAPPRYEHLTSNGVMTVQRLENGDWVALLRALRPGGKAWPTLNYVSLEELSQLLNEDSVSWLKGLGFAVGTWEGLNPAAKKFKQSVAISIPAEQSALLVLPWALTRVVALMKQLGAAKVVD